MATQWLSAEQQQTWRSFLTVSGLLTDQLGRELDGTHNLSIADYEILVRLSEAPDRQRRMSDLALEVVHSRSRLTHSVGRMEARGLVQRLKCPEDKRGVLCVLTDEGMTTLSAAAPDHVAQVRSHLFAHLDDDEVAVLGKAFDKVATHLRSLR